MSFFLPHEGVCNQHTRRIDIFFDYYFQLGRMFDKSPTELKLSLHVPPTHPDRPHPALLHAICGAASIYSDQIPPTRLPFRGRTPTRTYSLNLYKRLWHMHRHTQNKYFLLIHSICLTLLVSVIVALHSNAYTKAAGQCVFTLSLYKVCSLFGVKLLRNSVC